MNQERNIWIDFIRSIAIIIMIIYIIMSFVVVTISIIFIPFSIDLRSLLLLDIDYIDKTIHDLGKILTYDLVNKIEKNLT